MTPSQAPQCPSTASPVGCKARNKSGSHPYFKLVKIAPISYPINMSPIPSRTSIPPDHKSILAYEMRKVLGTDKTMRPQAREFVKLFEKLYEREFSEILPMNRRVATAYMKRAFVWIGEDSDKFSALIQFVVEKWTPIRRELCFTGKPSVSLFGSAKCFQRIRDLHQDGFSRGDVKQRFIEDDSPDEGW